MSTPLPVLFNTRALRRSALGLAIALGLNLPVDGATTTPLAPQTITVSNCNDAGPGSLREAIFQAVGGDTVDTSQLTCGEISLTTGHLLAGQGDLTIHGQHLFPTTINANYGTAAGGGGVIAHTGAGVLTLSGLHLRRGRSRDGDSGGCIRSAGSVTLRYSTLSECVAGTGVSGKGGGIWAQGVVDLDRAVVVDSRAGCDVAGGVALGAGIFAESGLLMRKSRVTGNTAANTPECRSYCAGIVINGGSAVIEDSSVDGNRAYSQVAGYGNVGGICDFAAGKYGLTIVNSTIADNTATGAFGGVYSNTSVILRNSTIARNISAAAGFAAGLHVHDNLAELQSSIVADNRVLGQVLDLTSTGSVVGGNNLITWSEVSPPGTLSDDPVLATLADNGGSTPTMALAGWSPAIDRGNNSASLATDQRGYSRVSGAATDIGAFELQTDVLFRDGFESASPG